MLTNQDLDIPYASLEYALCTFYVIASIMSLCVVTFVITANITKPNSPAALLLLSNNFGELVLVITTLIAGMTNLISGRFVIGFLGCQIDYFLIYFATSNQGELDFDLGSAKLLDGLVTFLMVTKSYSLSYTDAWGLILLNWGWSIIWTLVPFMTSSDGIELRPSKIYCTLEWRSKKISTFTQTGYQVLMWVLTAGVIQYFNLRVVQTFVKASEKRRVLAQVSTVPKMDVLPSDKDKMSPSDKGNDANVVSTSDKGTAKATYTPNEMLIINKAQTFALITFIFWVPYSTLAPAWIDGVLAIFITIAPVAHNLSNLKYESRMRFNCHRLWKSMWKSMGFGGGQNIEIVINSSRIPQGVLILGNNSGAIKTSPGEVDTVKMVK